MGALLPGRHADAVVRFEESLRLYRQLGHDLGVAWSLDHLGWAAVGLDDLSGVEPVFEESFSLFRRSRGAPGRTVTLSGFLLGTVSGSGTARVGKRKVSLRTNSLLLVEKGEGHRIERLMCPAARHVPGSQKRIPEKRIAPGFDADRLPRVEDRVRREEARPRSDLHE